MRQIMHSPLSDRTSSGLAEGKSTDSKTKWIDGNQDSIPWLERRWPPQGRKGRHPGTKNRGLGQFESPFSTYSIDLALGDQRVPRDARFRQTDNRRYRKAARTPHDP